MIRIITGKFKGKKLLQPGEQTRPLMDRIKTSIFDTLQPWINGANVLDVFAGSGSFGFESLSRDARKITFVEQDEEACAVILKNCKNLGCEDKCLLIKQPAEVALSKMAEQFDIIFLDPPFPMPVSDKLKILGLALQHLSADGLLIMRVPASEQKHLTSHQNLYKQKKYGKSFVGYLKSTPVEE